MSEHGGCIVRKAKDWPKDFPRGKEAQAIKKTYLKRRAICMGQPKLINGLLKKPKKNTDCRPYEKLILFVGSEEVCKAVALISVLPEDHQNPAYTELKVLSNKEHDPWLKEKLQSEGQTRKVMRRIRVIVHTMQFLYAEGMAGAIA